MIKEISEEDFYKETAELISTPSWKEIIFASKTPVLLLPQELGTSSRRQYYQTIFKEVHVGKVQAKYCFSKYTTAKHLQGLYDTDESIRRRFGDHMIHIKKLVDRDLIDLRYSETSAFKSGIVSEKIGMIHYKQPSSLKTEHVDLVTGRDLQPYTHNFHSLFKNLTRMDEGGFEQILLEAKKVYFKDFLLPKSEAIMKDIMGESARIESIAQTLFHLMELPCFPKSEVIKELFREYTKDLPNAEQDMILTKLLLRILETYSFLGNPIATVLGEKPKHGKRFKEKEKCMRKVLGDILENCADINTLEEVKQVIEEIEGAQVIESTDKVDSPTVDLTKLKDASVEEEAQELSGDKTDMVSTSHLEYKVFEGAKDSINCSSEDLKPFLIKQNDYDIFIHDVESTILIHGKDSKIKAGQTDTFLTLMCLLERVGSYWDYDDLFNAGTRYPEFKRGSTASKLMDARIRHIKKCISKVVGKSTVDKWFKTVGLRRVTIDPSLNSCLIRKKNKASDHE